MLQAFDRAFSRHLISELVKLLLLTYDVNIAASWCALGTPMLFNPVVRLPFAVNTVILAYSQMYRLTQ